VRGGIRVLGADEYVDRSARTVLVGSADTCVSWAGDTVILEAASGIVSAHHSDSD